MLTILAALVAVIGSYKFVSDHYFQSPEGRTGWQVEILEGYEPALIIDPNLAPADSLEMIPGIGPVLAERIVEYRNNQSNFEKIDSLIKVDGIGFEKLKQIRPYLKITGQ
jgi:competence ComEA-like helix-hairpin-helix protein